MPSAAPGFDKTQIGTRLPAAFLAFMGAQGVAIQDLMARYGLPELGSPAPALTLPVPQLHAFFADAERASGDSFLGLHVAQAVPKGSFHILEYACRTSATLGASLSCVAQFMSLGGGVVRVTADFTGPSGVLEERIPGYPLGTGHQGNDFFVAANVVLSRQLTERHVVPRRVWLAHPRPADISELEALMGTADIAFDAGANGLEFDAESVALPVVSADPALHELMRNLARSQNAGGSEERPFLAVLKRHPRDHLVQCVPSIAQASELLQMSPRTLQRRLSDEGTTYKKVVDSLRQELARHYLAEKQLPVGEVAFLLGYAEMSSFVRAFRRWTGTTPTAFRAA